jgi:hypothetical protein
MDGPLAFVVQDVPSEVLAFSLFITRWAEAGYKRGLKLDQSPWRPFRCSENVAGRQGQLFYKE